MQVPRFQPLTDEGVVFFPSLQPALRYYTRRSALLRWVWVSCYALRGEGWGENTAYVVDDYGNLMRITYVQASVAGSRSPT